MFTQQFWAYALERAIKTGAQAGTGFLGADLIGLLELDFIQLASVVGLAMLASVFTSLGTSESKRDVAVAAKAAVKEVQEGEPVGGKTLTTFEEFMARFGEGK